MKRGRGYSVLFLERRVIRYIRKGIIYEDKKNKCGKGV